MMKGFIKYKFRGWSGVTSKNFGIEKQIKIKNKIYCDNIIVPYLVQRYLFGTRCERIINRPDVMSITATPEKKNRNIFHIHSQAVSDNVFSAEGLYPFVVHHNNNKYTVGGKIVIKNSVTNCGIRCGFVTRETRTHLTVELVGTLAPKTMVVPKPTYSEAANNGNGGYLFATDLEYGGYFYKVIEYDPLRFQFDEISRKMRILLPKMAYKKRGRRSNPRYELFGSFSS